MGGEELLAGRVGGVVDALAEEARGGGGAGEGLQVGGEGGEGDRVGGAFCFKLSLVSRRNIIWEMEGIPV